MSYVTKFLKQAGVNTAYQDDRTKAQIEEANKANPLSGYGFMSAQQKQQRQLAAQLYEAQQKREQEMMQQQLIARMSSQEKIGHYAGAGLMGLMSHLKSRGQSPEVPNVVQDDPEVSRFNELSAELGQAGALDLLGRELGNAGMIAEAARLRAEEEKARTDVRYKNTSIQNMESQIADRAAKPNPVISTEATGPDGLPYKVSKEVLGKGEDGQNIYRDLGRGVKGGVHDTKEGFTTSSGGINERTKLMEGTLVSTANAFDSYDKLEKLAAESKAGGWAGSLTAKAEDIVSGLKNFGTQVMALEERQIDDSVNKPIDNWDWSRLEKFAGANAKIKSLVLELAYARAAATGDSSRSLSDRDVQNQLDQIGGSISNPKIFLDLVKQNKELMVSKLENLGRYTRIDGKPIYDAYRSDIEALKKRAGVVGIGDMINERYGSEEAARARYLELKKKHGR